MASAATLVEAHYELTHSLCRFRNERDLARRVLAELLNQNYDDTKCAGYLGCSAGVKIGPAETPTSGAQQLLRGSGAPHPDQPGCGKALPATRRVTVVGSTSGYTHFTVYGTGATLGMTIPIGLHLLGPGSRRLRSQQEVPTVYVGQGCGPTTAPTSARTRSSPRTRAVTRRRSTSRSTSRATTSTWTATTTATGLESQEWRRSSSSTPSSSNYCVDNDRVYVAATDVAGWPRTWGCYFAGDGLHPGSDPTTQRVFAPEYDRSAARSVDDGGEPPNQPPCNGPVAALWVHDLYVAGNPIRATTGLARVLKMNGCDTSATSPTVTWHSEIPGIGDVCKEYTSCPKETPVVFCTTTASGTRRRTCARSRRTRPSSARSRCYAAQLTAPDFCVGRHAARGRRGHRGPPPPTTDAAAAE